MNALDDKLRRSLHDAVANVEPSERAWDRIEWKLAADRRRRRRVRGGLTLLSAAALVVAVVTSVTVLGDTSDDVSVDVGSEGSTDSTTQSPTTESPTTSEGTPTTDGTAPLAVTPSDQQGIWPFTTGEQADRWAGGADAPGSADGDFRDPVATAAGFVREVAGMTDFTTSQFMAGDSRSGEVQITSGPARRVTTVLVRLLGESDAWTVIGSAADHIRLTSPGPLEQISNPVRVSGESCCAFEGNVVLEIRARGASNEQLGITPVIGGSMGDFEPWSTDLSFAATDGGVGILLAYTSSAADGSIEQASAVPVWWEPDGTVHSS